jgi:DNA-binding PadR family transcriptional regulator
MSEKILLGSLDTLALLLFLNSKMYISSGDIRKQFHEIEPGTIYQKIRKLSDQGFIEKRTLKMERAGDDQVEYKLTEKGAEFRNKLVNRGLTVLKGVIDSMVKKQFDDTEKPFIEDKKEQIKNFLMEFWGECTELVDKETLGEQQKVLGRLLKKYL